MVDFKKEFVTNKKLEDEGAWVDIGDDGAIKVARAGNKKAIAHMRTISAPYTSQIRFGKLPDDVATKIAIETIAETILLDWKGITYDGKPLPYSKENAIRLLTESEDFRELVSNISSERKTFQQELDEAITKN